MQLNIKKMETKNNYYFSIANSLHKYFYEGRELDKLIINLERIEQHECIAQGRVNLELLIRFGGSPIQYSIKDFRRDLNSATSTQENRNFLLDQIHNVFVEDPSYLVITFNRL